MKYINKLINYIIVKRIWFKMNKLANKWYDNVNDMDEIIDYDGSYDINSQYEMFLKNMEFKHWYLVSLNLSSNDLTTVAIGTNGIFNKLYMFDTKDIYKDKETKYMFRNNNIRIPLQIGSVIVGEFVKYLRAPIWNKTRDMYTGFLYVIKKEYYPKYKTIEGKKELDMLIKLCIINEIL